MSNLQGPFPLTLLWAVPTPEGFRFPAVETYTYVKHVLFFYTLHRSVYRRVSTHTGTGVHWHTELTPAAAGPHYPAPGNSGLALCQAMDLGSGTAAVGWGHTGQVEAVKPVPENAAAGPSVIAAVVLEVGFVGTHGLTALIAPEYSPGF